jgi:hypothetical protein
MARAAGALAAAVGFVLRYAILVIRDALGPVLITLGASMIYRPLGFIVAGIWIIALGWRPR